MFVQFLTSIEARDETSALVGRIKTRHECRCEEATSTLHSKKKSTQDWGSADQQWVHREDTNPTYMSSFGSWISSKMYSSGYCFIWSCFSSQNLVMYSHVSKINGEKKLWACKKNVHGHDAAGMRSRVGRTATESQKLSRHNPIDLPKRIEFEQNGRPFWVMH